MEYKIIRGEGFSCLRLTLGPTDEIKAESDSLVLRDKTIELTAGLDGGVTSSIMRRLGNESSFMQHLKTSEGKSGNVLLSSKKIGDLFTLNLVDGVEGYLVQKDGFLAAEKNVGVHTHTQGIIKSLFSKEGMFILKLVGRGQAWIEGFGKVFEYNLAPGDELVVNNEHLVAWEIGMQYEIVKAGKGIVSSILSGGGFACRVSGPGKVMVQTHSRQKFHRWIGSGIKMPKPQKQPKGLF